MILQCPNCLVRLRLNASNDARRQLLIRCPECLGKFKVRSNRTELQALIAHEDELVSRQLIEQLNLVGVTAKVCLSESEVLARLQPAGPSVLLLDVGFNGTFPFQVIEKIKAANNDLHKIVLLPSVYNHTAYKRRPESLYGADGYLELHHIGDQLLALLADQFPHAGITATKTEFSGTAGGERMLAQNDVAEQADKLARILVADILLYHQGQLEHGIASGQLATVFAEPLAEGRRILFSRLPAAVELEIDFVQQAFDAICRSYSRYEAL
jgi:CheY-like chemotaxis protein